MILFLLLHIATSFILQQNGNVTIYGSNLQKV